MTKRVDQLFHSLNFNEPYFRTPTPANAGRPHVITIKKPQFTDKTDLVLQKLQVKTKTNSVRKMKSAAAKAISATKVFILDKSKPGSKAKIVKMGIVKKKSAAKVKSTPKFKSDTKKPLPPNPFPGVKKIMSPYLTKSAVKVNSAVKVKSTTKALSATKVKSNSNMNSASKNNSATKTRLVTKTKSNAATKAVPIIRPHFGNKEQTLAYVPVVDIESHSKNTSESFTMPLANTKSQRIALSESINKPTAATKFEIKPTSTVAKQHFIKKTLPVLEQQIVTTLQNKDASMRARTIQTSPSFQLLSKPQALAQPHTTDISATTTISPAPVFSRSTDQAKLQIDNKMQSPSLCTNLIKPKVFAKVPPAITDPQPTSISKSFYRALLEIKPPSAPSKPSSRYVSTSQPQKIVNALHITKLPTTSTPLEAVKSVDVTALQSLTNDSKKIDILTKQQLPSKTTFKSDAKMTKIFPPAASKSHNNTKSQTATKLVATANSQIKLTHRLHPILKAGSMQISTKLQKIVHERDLTRPQTRFRIQTTKECLPTFLTVDSTKSPIKDAIQSSTKLQTNIKANITIKPLAVELSTGEKMAATTVLPGTKSSASWQTTNKTSYQNRTVHRTVIKAKAKMSCSTPHLKDRTTSIQPSLPIPVCTSSVLRPSKANLHGQNIKTRVPQANNPNYKKMCRDFDEPDKRIITRAVKLLESQTRTLLTVAKSLTGLKATARASRHSSRQKQTTTQTTFSGLKIRK